MRKTINRSFNSVCCLLLTGYVLVFSGCTSSKRIDPYKKYPPEALKKDYTIFRNVLQENHPSLYWYTTKDSLDYFFNAGYQAIRDSMTETGFRTLLNYTISKINCGHTSVNYSKTFRHHLDTSHLKQFPLSLKVWDDTAVVYNNLLRNDTLLTKGTIIKSINGRPFSFYRDSIFQFISSDGYNTTHKYQSLSNRSGFGSWYKGIFGLSDTFSIGYLDTLNNEHTALLPVYDPQKDSLYRRHHNFPRPSQKERRHLKMEDDNNAVIDTPGKMAILTVGTFVNGNGIRRLFRKTFRKLKHLHIESLVIDVRNNGGGEVNNSTLLTRYIATTKFKLADSLYAVNKKSHYGKYIDHYNINRLFITLMSHKRSDGRYHFGYFERHYFKPKKKFHFDGNVYVITGGNSFSATTLFAHVLKGEKRVTLIGEETGGGSYGNTAWLIPDVTLPETKIRFRLPIYHLVESVHFPKTGRGVFPDIEVRPGREDIIKGIDVKMEKALQLIRNSPSSLYGQ